MILVLQELTSCQTDKWPRKKGKKCVKLVERRAGNKRRMDLNHEERILSIWASLQEEEEVSDQAYLHREQAKPSLDPNWVICKESNSSPSTRWHIYSVPLYWVNKVEVLRIVLGVEIPKALANDKEIEPMKVKRMAFCTKNASVLHHQLHSGVIG